MPFPPAPAPPPNLTRSTFTPAVELDGGRAARRAGGCRLPRHARPRLGQPRRGRRAALPGGGSQEAVAAFLDDETRLRTRRGDGRTWPRGGYRPCGLPSCGARARPPCATSSAVRRLPRGGLLLRRALADAHWRAAGHRRDCGALRAVGAAPTATAEEAAARSAARAARPARQAGAREGRRGSPWGRLRRWLARPNGGRPRPPLRRAFLVFFGFYMRPPLTTPRKPQFGGDSVVGASLRAREAALLLCPGGFPAPPRAAARPRPPRLD